MRVIRPSALSICGVCWRPIRQMLSAEQARADAVEKAKAEADRIERLKADAKRQAAERERAAKISRLREELAEAETLAQIEAAERVVAAWLALAANDREAVAAGERLAAARQHERDERVAEEARKRELEREREKAAEPVALSAGPTKRSSRLPLVLGQLAVLVVAALAVVFVIGRPSGQWQWRGAGLDAHIADRGIADPGNARCDVRAGWRRCDGGAYLHVNCHVGGFLNARPGPDTFRRHDCWRVRSRAGWLP